MRVTICELPHESGAARTAWTGLCDHAGRHRSELVLLPEFAMVDPVWESDHFDAGRWQRAEAVSDAWLRRLGELGAPFVAGTRPASANGQRFNEGYLWSAASGMMPLRRKFFMPSEPGCWERRWFDRGDAAFPAFRAGTTSFGMNICTELWALDTYADYAAQGVQVILSPRATAAATTEKWLAAGIVAAVRAGAFSVSSNRVDSTGAGGGVGWIVAPDGEVLVRTSRDVPYATVDVDLELAERVRAEYPGYVFAGM